MLFETLQGECVTTFKENDNTPHKKPKPVPKNQKKCEWPILVFLFGKRKQRQEEYTYYTA